MTLATILQYNWYHISNNGPIITPNNPLWCILRDIKPYKSINILFESDNEIIIKTNEDQYITMAIRKPVSKQGREFITNYKAIKSVK